MMRSSLKVFESICDVLYRHRVFGCFFTCIYNCLQNVFQIIHNTFFFVFLQFCAHALKKKSIISFVFV